MYLLVIFASNSVTSKSKILPHRKSAAIDGSRCRFFQLHRFRCHQGSLCFERIGKGYLKDVSLHAIYSRLSQVNCSTHVSIRYEHSITPHTPFHETPLAFHLFHCLLASHKAARDASTGKWVEFCRLQNTLYLPNFRIVGMQRCISACVTNMPLSEPIVANPSAGPG